MIQATLIIGLQTLMEQITILAKRVVLVRAIPTAFMSTGP